MKWLAAEKYIGSENFTVVRKTITDVSFPLHWHDFFEIEVILGGRAKQILNGKEYILEAGYVYLLTPTDFHELETEKPTELFNIMFHECMMTDEFLRLISGNRSEMIIKLNGEEFERLKDLCTILENEVRENSIFKNNIIRNLLECIMMHIFSHSLKTGKAAETDITEIQKAIRYINLHFKENPALSDVAKTVNYNPNYFSQKFKDETGMGYSEYLNSRKIKYAKLLLKSSALTITEICYASGFTSISNFIRCFKKEEGLTPSAFRKNI